VSEYYRESIREFVWLVMGGLAGASLYATFAEPYQQGQIDCATGKMQYELKKHESGTVEWERKMEK